MHESPFLHMTRIPNPGLLSTWGTPRTQFRGAALNAPHLCPQSSCGAAMLHSAWCPWSLSTSASLLTASGPQPFSSHADASGQCLTVQPSHPFPAQPLALQPGFPRLGGAECSLRVLLQGPRAGPGGGVLRMYVSFLHRADMCSAIPQASLTYRNQ